MSDQIIIQSGDQLDWQDPSRQLNDLSVSVICMHSSIVATDSNDDNCYYLIFLYRGECYPVPLITVSFFAYDRHFSVFGPEDRIESLDQAKALCAKHVDDELKAFMVRCELDVVSE